VLTDLVNISVVWCASSRAVAVGPTTPSVGVFVGIAKAVGISSALLFAEWDMPLSEMKCRNMSSGPRLQKLSDGGGLQLWVLPSGGRLWRIAYRLGESRSCSRSDRIRRSRWRTRQTGDWTVAPSAELALVNPGTTVPQIR
jgi:hypothetical protein